MKPYYNHGGIMIFHGDCVEVMRHIDQVPSLVIADPPYGDTALGWDKRIDGWPQEAFYRVAENASLWCFGSFRMFYECDGFAPWRLAQDLIWEKHNGSSFHADRFKRVHEHVVQFYRGDWTAVYKNPVIENVGAERKTVRRKMQPAHTGTIGTHFYDESKRFMRSVIYQRSCHGEAVHPTQKPIDLIATLLQYSAEPGKLVLDPFMGSGSTLVACKQRGLPAIGIEIDEAYCAAAVKRLSQEVLDLQECPA